MTLEEMRELLRTPHQAAKLSRDEIPTLQGLYVWSSAKTREILYVGKASGRSGLRGRIWRQHLNPKYLESREAKFQPADDFQRGCNVVVGGKLCVDKSVFRRSIGHSLRLAPGEETVRYIREHLAVAWVTFTSDLASEIPRMELELIRDLRPSLNVNGVVKDARSRVDE